MNVAQWAEIRRLSEIEGLSKRAISRQLHCSQRTVKNALALAQPPDPTQRAVRGSILDPYKPKIRLLLGKYPDLSAVRILQEIAKPPEGYGGEITLVRDYLRQVRPAHHRVYQEVYYEPGQAMQVDWGSCGRVLIGQTQRQVSVFVAVLCYSRLSYIEFCLSQRKAEFYRALVHALTFFQGSPKQIIFDNLKAAVLNGHGRSACLHPEFLALCGHFCMEPIACARRDPESKGVVEGGVRYVKRNALAGRAEELTCWEDYGRLAVQWRDEVANVRLHQTTKQRPVDRFQEERPRLRPLPALPFDTDEILSVIVNSHARVHFDANRYSVPPELVDKTALLRADAKRVRVFYQGQEVASHQRCYERGQVLCLDDHRLAALKLRNRVRARDLEDAFDALGPAARQFHLELRRRPVRTAVHLRRVLNLVRLYGRADVLAALTLANQYGTYDAAYVQTLVLQERRRRELPSPTPLRPRRQELIDEIQLAEPDPAAYDRLCEDTPQTTPNSATSQGDAQAGDLPSLPADQEPSP